MSDSYWDGKPDLTRLPAYLKATLDKPIPLRPDEVRAKVLVFPTVGHNHPNGRILIAPSMEEAEEVAPTAVRIELLDYGGKTPLAMGTLSPKHFAELFRGAIDVYAQCGGDLDELKKIIEEITNGRRNS